jgi:hypothetical protein
MRKVNIGTHTFFLVKPAKIPFIIAIIIFVSACAQQPAKQVLPPKTSAAQAAQTEVATAAPMTKTAESPQQSTPATQTGPQPDTAAEPDSPPVPAISSTALERLSGKESPAVIDFCQTQPYVEYEKKSQSHIKKAWQAKQAGAFAVGFRNQAEYKKWVNTQKQLFDQVLVMCKSLAFCKTENSKEGACKTEQSQFNAWQDAAKSFLDKTQLLDSQQPSQLCTIKPSLENDLSCFEQLADNVDKSCHSPVCRELGQCWRSVAIMDDVIRQAESSCRFARIPLNECRGYTTAVRRKKSHFAKCETLKSETGLIFQPVL